VANLRFPCVCSSGAVILSEPISSTPDLRLHDTDIYFAAQQDLSDDPLDWDNTVKRYRPAHPGCRYLAADTINPVNIS
jgi:hypothetical protein